MEVDITLKLYRMLDQKVKLQRLDCWSLLP